MSQPTNPEEGYPRLDGHSLHLAGIRRRVRVLFCGQGLTSELVRRSIWSVALKLAAVFGTLIVSVLLARQLGSQGFGVYSFVLAIVSLLVVPAQLGMPSLVVRETAKAQVSARWDVMRGLWRWATIVVLAWSLTLTVVASAAVFILAEQTNSVLTQPLVWGLAAVPFVALGGLRSAALRGLRHLAQAQLPDFILRPAFLGCLLLTFPPSSTTAQLGAAEAMKLHLVASILAFVVGTILLVRARPDELRTEPLVRTDAAAWVASAVPLAWVGGAHIIVQNVGAIVLGTLSSVEQVAMFRVAMQGAMLVGFGSMAAKLATAPYLARLHAQGATEDLQHVVKLHASMALITAVPIAVVFILAGPSLLGFSFGPQFRDAYWPLIVLAIGQLIGSFGASVPTLLSMTGRDRDVAFSMTVSVIVSSVFAAVLVPVYGALGAAIGVTMSMFIAQYLLWRRMRRHLGLPTFPFRIALRW